MCGTVSFKKGDAFFHAHKVTFQKFNEHSCEATVSGTEDFHVVVEKEAKGSFSTKCSCPTLPSFRGKCQHIAAVLLSIYDKQSKKSAPYQSSKQDTESLINNDLLSLFDKKAKRLSVHQLHFENRKLLDAEFFCKLVQVSKDQHMMGLGIEIGSIRVQNIREFLEKIYAGEPSVLTNVFTFDPNLHCVIKEADSVIQQLILLMNDEKMFEDVLIEKSNFRMENDLFLIPPSYWKKLVPFLINAPSVKIEYDNHLMGDFFISDKLLPIVFDFQHTEGRGYSLKISGLNDIIILDSYQSVLSEGKLFQFNAEEIERLLEIKQMVEKSGTNQIPVQESQLGIFIEKVVPGLKKLGEVRLSAAIMKQLEKIPLTAKLYLDRLKNRLLAGLEFHYENYIINPLEDWNQQGNHVILRDKEKENIIMQLMEESSFARTDSGYYLHNEELEYEFLHHVIPKLQHHVQIYATTAVRNRILKENPIPRIRVNLKKERTNWLEFKFELDGISDKEIKGVLQALEEKRKYYRLRNGSLFSLESRELEEIKRFLAALPIQNEDWEGKLNVPLVQGLQLLSLNDDHSVFSIEESFRQFLEKIAHPDRLDFEVPKGLDGILRDYQVHGYKWMKSLAGYGFGGILGDSMGLGKTLQSITFILSELPFIRKNHSPILIVCPSSLTYNWLSELMKFAPEIQAIVVDGNLEERRKIQKEAMDIDVFITSYPLIRKDIKWFEQQTFHTVFFDEAQAFKNPITQTARAVKRLQANHRFALTGTPIENSLEELWSIFHVVFPELFKGLKEYSNLTKEQIKRRIRPFLLRRLKKDVLSELPEKIEWTHSVELLHDQKKLYAAYLAKLRQDTLKHLDKDTLRKNKIKILAGLTRLRQICCHPALFVSDYKGSSAKFNQLMQLIEEAKLTGRRILIFSQFTKMLELIGKELAKQGLSYFYLDGQTPSENRLEICNRFNNGERDLFLISLKAGGTGLNLTGADTVILYDLWWNPAVEEQAADRAHRIGQENKVEVIKLVARGTIEEKMNELQEKKRDLIHELIDTGDKASSTLTEDDIRELLMI